MMRERVMAKRNRAKIALLVIFLLAAVPAHAADQPLTKDDLTLLLLGGATSQKVIALIEQRGVDFKMTPDLAKRFHDLGADDSVIEALQKVGQKAESAPASPSPTPPSAAESRQPAPASAPAPSAPPARRAATQPNAPLDLTDPSPERTQQIVQEFATKEKLFKLARNNYTYHQINKVETVDADGNVDGTYQQEWDIVYDDKGGRVERVTYAPVDTLQRIYITPEDMNSFRAIQPFVLTVDELPEYEVKYMGHVKLDEIAAYVFSIRPKEIQKGKQYFQGVVWVDDRDLQIVKSQGKPVPELKTKKGENLFPRFTTYREQIDGKFWFPTFTIADDTLFFPGGPPVHIKEILRYTDYKQFKASSSVKIIPEPPEQTNSPSQSKPKVPK